MKIVINAVYGGFSISEEAEEFVAKRGNKQALAVATKYPKEYKRDDPDLVAAVETLGNKANGCFAKLKIVEIPDDVKWTIEEYDGLEWIAEEHRTWGHES